MYIIWILTTGINPEGDNIGMRWLDGINQCGWPQQM